MTTGGCASAASEIEAGSIYPTLQERRAAAAKQATCVTCYWCGVVWDAEGGRGLSVGRHSCTRRRQRVELWRIADWQKKDKHLKSNRVDNSGVLVPGLYPPKTGTMRFIRSMAGLVWDAFFLKLSMYLFLAPNGQGIRVSGRYPQKKLKQSSQTLLKPGLGQNHPITGELQQASFCLRSPYRGTGEPQHAYPNPSESCRGLGRS